MTADQATSHRVVGSLRDRAVGLCWSAIDRVIPRRERALVDPSSVLVIKPCCLGDVLFASALIRSIAVRFPRAAIDIVVGRHARPAIESNPRIRRIIDCGDLGAGRQFDFRQYLQLTRTLRRHRWDAAFVLDRSALFALLPTLAGIPIRAGIDSGGRGIGLTHRSPWREGTHEADVYLDVGRVAGIPVDDAIPEYLPRSDDLAWARQLRNSVAPDRPLTVLHPGGGVNPGMVLAAKRWPAERYGELGLALSQRGETIVIVGSDHERDVAQRVVGTIVAGGGEATDLAGHTTFAQLGALAAIADLWVGNDSGPTHLAAAAGAPTIGLFGPSTPEMYAPRGRLTRSIWNPPPCSPCFLRGRFNEACRSWICIEAISVAEVQGRIAELRTLRQNVVAELQG